MSWLSKLFNLDGTGKRFRKVDWSEVEGRVRALEALYHRPDQLAAKDLILQGDNLVDFILKNALVTGKTMGERLKNIKTKMPRSTYQQAWSLHLKRNELAHETGSFVADWEKNTHFNNLKVVISALRSLK